MYIKNKFLNFQKKTKYEQITLDIKNHQNQTKCPINNGVCPCITKYPLTLVWIYYFYQLLNQITKQFTFSCKNYIVPELCLVFVFQNVANAHTNAVQLWTQLFCSLITFMGKNYFIKIIINTTVLLLEIRNAYHFLIKIVKNEQKITLNYKNTYKRYKNWKLYQLPVSIYKKIINLLINIQMQCV